MYGWNGFFYKNVLSAAYNQVRFIVRNLRYIKKIFAKLLGGPGPPGPLNVATPPGP